MFGHVLCEFMCSYQASDIYKIDTLAGYVPSFLGYNIKVVEWLPQNDLLAHKGIKAFVSHVGHNSLYESAYHGVPVVAFPLYAEQHSNAKKAEHFGIGLTVYRESTNAQQLFEKIEQAINEPRYVLLDLLFTDSERSHYCSKIVE